MVPLDYTFFFFFKFNNSSRGILGEICILQLLGEGWRATQGSLLHVNPDLSLTSGEK